MLCGDFWLTGPDSFCTDFCTSCSRTCMHGAVMQSLWSSKLHNMLCWDFWLPGPNISHTEFCTSSTGPVSIAQLGSQFWSSYTVCWGEVSDWMAQIFHRLMRKAPKTENPWQPWILSRRNPSSVSTASCCRVVTVQFSLKWYLCTWKSPNALHPVSQKRFSEHHLWNCSNVCLIDDGPLSSLTIVTQVS